MVCSLQVSRQIHVSYLPHVLHARQSHLPWSDQLSKIYQSFRLPEMYANRSLIFLWQNSSYIWKTFINKHSCQVGPVKYNQQDPTRLVVRQVWAQSKKINYARLLYVHCVNVFRQTLVFTRHVHPNHINRVCNSMKIIVVKLSTLQTHPSSWRPVTHLQKNNNSRGSKAASWLSTTVPEVLLSRLSYRTGFNQTCPWIQLILSGMAGT